MTTGWVTGALVMSLSGALVGCAASDTETMPSLLPSATPSETTTVHLASPASTPPASAPLTMAPTRRPLVALGEEPGPDFAFSLDYGACYSEAVDTFDGTLTRDTTPGGRQRVTIPLKLSGGQLRSIYQSMRAINVFGYPEHFIAPWPTGIDSGIGVEPHSTYKLVLRDRGVEHSIMWEDDTVTTPSSRDADGLRALFKFIMDMVKQHPEYRKLPSPDIGCW